VPVNPGQYSTISAAIAAASNGDTILVAGSATPYETGTLTINKRLVIIGAGYNPKGATPSTTIGQPVSITCAANGSTIIGFLFYNQVNYTASGGTSHSNLTFARNYFAYPGAMTMSVDSVVNNQFVNNIWGASGYANFNSASIRVIGTYFYNNVFLNASISIYLYNTTNQNVVVDHNLFLYGSNAATTAAYNAGIGGIRWATTGSAIYSTVSNNIFYNCAAFYNSGTVSNCIINNNITYTSTGQPTLPYSGSTGSGNINNTNPLMTTLFSSTANPNLDFNLDNLNLQSTSPCINAGSDGTNIGPTGGLYPIYNTNATALTGEPALPSVRTIAATGGTTIPTTGTLNITVTAKKLN
jgi:hypothetical protein